MSSELFWIFRPLKQEKEDEKFNYFLRSMMHVDYN